MSGHGEILFNHEQPFPTCESKHSYEIFCFLHFLSQIILLLVSFLASTSEFVAITRYIFKAAVLIRNSPFKPILAKLEETVSARRHEHMKGEHNKHNDFIDLFLNAEAEEEDIKRMADERFQDIERKHLKVDKKLTVPVSRVKIVLKTILASYI